MFTSDDCIYCPPVESIVREVVGGAMKDFIYVNTVDVNENPDAANIYGVHSLPTLMINDQIVLQGGMDDDTVREILWNTLLTLAVENKERVVKSKTSLLELTHNSWQSLTGTRMLRHNVGDFIHIAPYQLTLLSLYSLDPLVPTLVYQAGNQLGKYGIMFHVLSILEPRLGKTARRSKRLKYLLDALELYFSDKEVVPTYFADEAKALSYDDSSYTIEIKGLVSGALGIDVGEPMCDYTAGMLAGVTETLLGAYAVGEEIACAANRSDSCIFRITFGDNSTKRRQPREEDKIDINNRRLKFYESSHEIAVNLEESLFMRKRLRSIAGDFVHISSLQPIIVSLKLMDDFLGSILYSSGRELGLFGWGKTLLYEILDSMFEDEEEPYSLPLDIDSGVEGLYRYMTHPTTLLTKEWGVVRLKTTEIGDYMLNVYDYCAVAGISNVGKTLCDFLAGFLVGRLSVLIGYEASVEEVHCQGTGAEFCQFKITRNN